MLCCSPTTGPFFLNCFNSQIILVDLVAVGGVERITSLLMFDLPFDFRISIRFISIRYHSSQRLSIPKTFSGTVGDLVSLDL